MKSIIFTIVLSFALFFTNAQTTKSVSEGITITVNVPSNSTMGKMSISLFNESNFLQTPLVNLNSKIENGKATVSFKNVQPGKYAIVCYHDKNDDGEMNFEASGMPLEDYGSSNNVMSFGPPQWSDSKFEVTNEAVNIEIIL